MTCQEIRGGECKATVERNWKFCPTCGSVLGLVEPPSSVAFRVTPEEPSGLIELGYRGQHAIKVSASITSDPTGALSLADSERLISATSSLKVRIDPGRCADGLRASIRIVTFDATRTPAQYWTPLPERVHHVAVEAALAEGPRLVPDPGVLFFRAGRTVRGVTLRNEGDLPVRIERIEPPAGFRLGRPLDRDQIGPGESIEVIVEHRTGARDDTLGIVFEGGVSDVPIVCFPPPPPRAVVRYVVAVDFGTSNTTIGIRDTRTEEFEFLGDPHWPGKSSRFPTAVLLRDADPSNWEYGQRAIDEYDPNRHQIVYELKSYLRTNREPFAKRWAACTIDAIVAWYLRRLRLDIIEPELARRSAGSRSDIHFVFCLPVLDHGPQYERQRQRYEAAIRASGIPDLGEYSFQFEPVCAALYFLQGRKSGAPHHSFDEGDRVLVFDSGGGTTDIALFTAHELDDRAIEMKNVRQVGSHREGGESGASHQFGGTTLTQLIGFYQYTRDTPQGGGARLLAFANDHDGRDLTTFDESLRLTESGFIDIVPPEAEDGGESLRWHRRFPRTYRLVEDKKRALALLPNFDDVEMLYKDRQGEVYLERSELDLIVDVEMKKVLDPMLTDLASEGEQALDRIRHVFAVGGNSNIARIRERLLKKFSDRQLAELTPDQRIMAVPVGALFAYDPMSDRQPYSVAIVEETTGKTIVTTEELESGMGVPIEKQVRLHPLQEYRLKAIARWRGKEDLLSRFSIRNESSEETIVRWRVRLEGQLLFVETSGAGQWKEVWRYEL